MNKLAVLAFAILLFLSTMLWYLANGSLNDYLKSQVLLQSHYYSGQKSQLLSADFSTNTGITTFTNFSVANIDGLTQPQLFKVDNISVQLAELATSQFDAPSVAKKTTTLVHVKQLRFSNLHAWSEIDKISETGKTNLQILIKKVERKLATDYPALYPQLSAELYAKMYPERSIEFHFYKFDPIPNIQIDTILFLFCRARKSWLRKQTKLFPGWACLARQMFPKTICAGALTQFFALCVITKNPVSLKKKQ